MTIPPKVFLVGAGPGDPGLVTVRGLLCLSRADYVLYDGLANSRLLHFAPQAEHICVGKHGKTPIWPQEQIHAKMIELCQPGKQIVRLKGGDPAVFARTAEEAEALKAAGIGFEIVPGITSGLAVSSYVGIPLTHRDHASAVALVTGRQQAGADDTLDWEALARFPGTLVFYMGVTTAEYWTGKLIAAGKSPETPAAIVRRCSWPDQLTLRCSLGDVAKELTPASRIRPPVAVVVGKVADEACSYALGERAAFDEEEARQLSDLIRQMQASSTSADRGSRHSPSMPSRGDAQMTAAVQLGSVLLTASDSINRTLESELSQSGIGSVSQSLLSHRTIQPSEQLSAQITSQFQRIAAGEFTGVTFSSRQGVHSFFDLLISTGFDVRDLRGVKMCCVGPGTAEALLEHGIQADVVPSSEFGAASLVALLTGKDRDNPLGAFLVTTTNTSGHELAEGIRGAGSETVEVEVYETVPVANFTDEVRSAIAGGHIRFATATSSQIAKTLHSLLVEASSATGRLPNVEIVAFGDEIASVCDELGLKVAAVAKERTSHALSAALIESWRRLVQLES